MDTIRRLFAKGQKSAFETGFRAVTPNFVQTEVACERLANLPNKSGPLRVDFEIAVMSDLLHSVFLEVGVPGIEVEGHSARVAMTAATVTNTADFSLRATRTSDGHSAVLGTFTDAAFHTASHTAANGISLVPILSQIATALRTTTDAVFAGEFDVAEGEGLDVSASFGFKLAFESSASYTFLTVNGSNGFGGLVASTTGRVAPTEFATWAWGLGFAMIERLEVVLNNQVVETVYGDYLHFHEELHGRPGKSLEAACFRYKGITLPEMGALSKQGFRMYVPIPTFFSEGGAPLPIQKMRDCNREMKFRLYLRPLEELSLSLPDLTPTSFSAVSGNSAGLSVGGAADSIYQLSHLFDDSLASFASFWKAGGANTIPNATDPYFLIYDHGSPVALSKYRLFRHSIDFPQDWYVEASQDGTTWSVVDRTFASANLGAPTYTGTAIADNIGEGNEAVFNLESRSFRYYRWVFTSTTDASPTAYSVKLRELQLFTADLSVAPVAPVVANTWSDFDLKMWMGMTMLEGTEARALGAIDTSHVVKLVEPLHQSETPGLVIKGQEMRLDLRLRHPTTQLMWALADDARLERSVQRAGTRPYTEGVGSLVGPFCDVEDINVRRVGSKETSGLIRTSNDVQTTPRLFIPGNRFEFRGSDSNGQEVEPLEYVMLQINRANRFEDTMPPEYYRLVTPFSNRRVPLDDQRIYTYAFTPWASDPHRLSLGSLHFGRMHEKVLQIKTRTQSSKPVRFVGFAETYNVFLCNDQGGFAMKFV
jgi:hypothetical protein